MRDAPGSREQEQETLVYNKKIEGYLAIALSSLVNFANITDVSVASVANISLKDDKLVAFFGIVSFLICFLVISFDRIAFLHKKIDFKELWDGKLEGYMLLFLMVWWIVGVGLSTKANGIGYVALNTYFSSWFSLIMSVYTLDQWTSAKDIISIHELTHLSVTLKYWYMLFIVSLIEVGSAVDVLVVLARGSFTTDGISAYAVLVGAVSAPLAFIAILAHYKLICCNLKSGGVTELLVAISLFLWWIIAVSLLTEANAIAATIQGTQAACGSDEQSFPGNNLYLALWLGLYSSAKICLEWKAAKARHMSDAMHKISGDDSEVGKGPEANDDVD